MTHLWHAYARCFRAPSASRTWSSLPHPGLGYQRLGPPDIFKTQFHAVWQHAFGEAHLGLARPNLSNEVYVLYTSGTTGRPKGRRSCRCRKPELHCLRADGNAGIEFVRVKDRPRWLLARSRSLGVAPGSTQPRTLLLPEVWAAAI